MPPDQPSPSGASGIYDMRIHHARRTRKFRQRWSDKLLSHTRDTRGTARCGHIADDSVKTADLTATAKINWMAS